MAHISEQPTHISAEIRRQIGTEANKRYLGALPIFKVDPKLPESFDHLLDGIDHAETRKRRRTRR